MKILISGAGIAGNSLAFWLSKQGHKITVVEQFPSLRATGLQIDLRGHGIEVLKHMRLEEAFRAKAAPENGMQIVDKSGRRWGYFPANKSGKGLQSFTTEYEIMRGDLCHILYDAAVDNGAEYIFGTSVESFENKQDSVTVRFANGNTGQFDLLVGADGQWSRTRRMILDTDKDAFYPVEGQYIGYFTIPRPIEKGEEYIATFYVASKRRGIVTRRHSPSAMQVYLLCTNKSTRLKTCRGNVQEEKQALTEIFKGAGWQTESILESLQTADDFYCERLGLVKLDSWSRNRVVLLGDAAYCPSANTGMGTTSSLVGAYILAGEIGQHCGRSGGNNDGGVDGKEPWKTALEGYEDKFRPFMNQVQNGVLEDDGSNGMAETAFGVVMFNCIMGVASLFRLNVFGKWILKERVRGWELPRYEDMLKL